MKQQKKEVNKHVATIQCSNGLSLLQRKISNALLFHAYDHLQTTEEHQILIKQLCSYIDYKGNNHAAIKTALRGLITTLIEWNVIDEVSKLEDWSASSALASVRLHGPVCYFAYSPRMRELLHSPIMYGKINLLVQAKFKSNYGLALYENCIRYRGVPYTKWFNLDMFRRLMGVPADQYLIFRDFKRRVLDKSVAEVNAHSEIFVMPEIRKQGRVVTEIRFKLREQAIEHTVTKEVTTVTDQKPAHHPDLLNLLTTQYKLSLAQANDLLKQYTADKIYEKIALIERSLSYKNSLVTNLAGYLITALKKDYQFTNNSKTIGSKHTSVIKHEVDVKKDAKTAYATFLNTRIKENFAALSETVQDELKTQFLGYLRNKKNDFVLGRLKQHGFDSQFVTMAFHSFLQQVAKEQIGPLPSFEEYEQDSVQL